MTASREIRELINSSKPNSLFVLKDFITITNMKNIKVIINRLVKEQIIFRLIDGIYYKPYYFEEANEYIPISIYSIADKIADQYNWNICPAGESALNYLGLSTQIMNAYIFKSDGPYREYKIDNKILKFKHTNNKDIKNISMKSAVVIESLKFIGKKSINDEIIAALKNRLTVDEKKLLLEEASKASSWIYDVICKVVK